ncbi:hypothetical protein [Aliivibrio fischeri]|uniref:hypothetical protein n=1 Tax=Aliivibrio fischeri TaxID=668 RepID=UPI0007C5167A|nr:hypothetical protein [Aliivibrio fischeri]
MKIIVHFGFPKTGSSTLQFGLFKPLSEDGQLLLSTWRLNDENESHDRRPSSQLFCRKPILDEYLNFDDEKLNILSDESFTAPIKLRVNNFGHDIEDPINFPKLIKKQLIEKFGHDIEIQAFITIRNQSKQIYSQYVEEYNLKRYKNVDLVFDEQGNVDLNGFDIYKYDEYINTLNSVFSEENVSVLFFEEWKNNFDEFTLKLSEIFDIEHEIVKKQLTNNHVNQKPKKDGGYFTKDGKDFIPYFSNEDMNKIKDYFYEDNLKLQKRFNGKYDLKELGYL